MGDGDEWQFALNMPLRSLRTARPDLPSRAWRAGSAEEVESRVRFLTDELDMLGEVRPTSDRVVEEGGHEEQPHEGSLPASVSVGSRL